MRFTAAAELQRWAAIVRTFKILSNTMSIPCISKEAARRYVLGRQGLWLGRRWAGKEGTAQALRYMECLQMDPLNVIARSHDLALWGRVLDYRPDHMETLMYRRTGKDADLPKHWRAACFAWPDS